MALGSKVALFTASHFPFLISIRSLLIKTTLQEKVWSKNAPVFSLGASDKESQKRKSRDSWIDIENHYSHRIATVAQDFWRLNAKCVICNINPKAPHFLSRLISDQCSCKWPQWGSERGARDGCRKKKKGSHFERVSRKWWNGADTL